MLKRFFVFLLVVLLIFFGLIAPAFSAPLRIFPQTKEGVPDWTQVSFDNMGSVQDSNTGILDDLGMMDQLGYNPSRSYREGDSVSKIIKVGDLEILTRQKKDVGDFLGGADLSKVSLGEFPAINGASVNDLIQSVPGFGKVAAQSVPLIQGIMSGSPSQITSGGLGLAQSLSPEVSGFLKSNPWAANLPIEQLIQGDWEGALSKGVEIGLPMLIKEVPSLAQVPIGDLFGSAMSGDYKGLFSTGAATLANKFGGTALANVPVGDIVGGLMSGDYRGLLQTGINMSVQEFAKQFPALANAPIGALANINNFSMASIPNIASMALATPWIRNQIIKNVPGLANVPLDSLLTIFKAATAKVDFPDQGAGIAPRALTGGGSSFMSIPCAGPACGNFEINQAKALIPADRLNGLQFVVGSLKSSKGQSTKGGIGPLGKMFGGKEPVHIRPWGDDANVAMAALGVNDAKGTAQLGFYLRVCIKPLFLPRTCTPYAIGPIPFKSVHEGDVVVIQSTSPPPISAPDIGGGGYSDCGSSKEKYGHKQYEDADKSKLRDVSTGGAASGRNEKLNNDAASSFEKMRSDAAKEGINLYALSGYRSKEEQTTLWNQQVAKQGSEEAAAKISAPPGYSEHHTGYAIDIGTSPSTDLSSSFESTPAYKWVQQNGKRYGFEQSFTGQPGQGADEEAWHYRFVGSDSARNTFSSAATLASSGQPSQGNVAAYLGRISWGESSGGVNLGTNDGEGPYGEYQFIPTTRAEIKRKYGVDGWSQNKKERDQAVIALIKDIGGQKTLDAIAAGNFDLADQVLNGTWTSLPGGAESNWTSETLAKYGRGNGGGGGVTLVSSNSASCGGIECPKTGPCYLHHPLPDGVITSAYGPRGGRIHHGVDLQSKGGYAGKGDPVLAADDGQVIATPDFFDGQRNYGYRIEISHPQRSLVTTSNHLASRNVQPGAKVKRGQRIATEGNTSGGMPIHLHFETQRGPGLVNGDFNPVELQYQPAMR